MGVFDGFLGDGGFSLDNLMNFDAGTEYFTGNRKGKAMQGVATAQEREARSQRQEAIGAAEPTVDELKALEKQVQLYERTLALHEAALDRQQKLVEAIDPSLIEAGKQMYSLLQGKEAPIVDPMRQERIRQRTQMENQLREQLGTGYASSTAGQKALSDFDTQTSNVLAQGQQQGIQTLGSVFGQFSAARPNQMASIDAGAQTLGSISNSTLSGFQNIQNRKLGAMLGTSVTPYAGSQYAGALARAQSSQEAFGGVMKLGGLLATAA
jgi:hypothetical protein